MIEGVADGVPGAALPVWPPPTALSPAGAGGGGFQARAGAAVLPPPAPQPPPVPQQPAAPPPGDEPVWPAEPPTSSQYGDWARRQRPQGTVYGGAPPAYDRPVSQPPPAYEAAPYSGAGPYAAAEAGRPGFETSGSLTGHILSQGRPERESSASSKVVMIILIIMSLLVVGGLALGIAYLSGVFH